MQENKLVDFNPLDLLATAAALQTVNKNSHDSMNRQNNNETEIVTDIVKSHNASDTPKENDIPQSCFFDLGEMFHEHNYENAKKIQKLDDFSHSKGRIVLSKLTDKLECMSKQEIVNKTVISSDEHVARLVIDGSSEFIDNNNKTTAIYSGGADQDVTGMKLGSGDTVGDESKPKLLPSIVECTEQYVLTKELGGNDISMKRIENVDKEVNLKIDSIDVSPNCHSDKIQVHISSPLVDNQTPVEESQAPSLIINIDIDRDQTRETLHDKFSLSPSSSPTAKHTIIRSLLTGEQHSLAKIAHTNTSIENSNEFGSNSSNMPNQISQKSGLFMEKVLNSVNNRSDESSLIGFCVPESDVTGTGLVEDTDKIQTSEDENNDSCDKSGSSTQTDIMNLEFIKKVNEENWNSPLSKELNSVRLVNESQFCHKNNQCSALSASDKDVTSEAHSSCLGLKCVNAACEHDDKFQDLVRQDECKASQDVMVRSFSSDSEIECDGLDSKHGSYVADHCYAGMFCKAISSPIEESDKRQTNESCKSSVIHAVNANANIRSIADQGQDNINLWKTQVISDGSFQKLQSRDLQNENEKETSPKKAILTVGEWLNDTLSPSNLKPVSQNPLSSLKLDTIAVSQGKSCFGKTSPQNSVTSVGSAIHLGNGGIVTCLPNNEIEQSQNSSKYGKFKIGSFASFSISKSDVDVENTDQEIQRNLMPTIKSPVSQHVGLPPWKLHGVKDFIASNGMERKLDCISNIHHDHDYCFKNGVQITPPNIYTSELSKELLSPLKGFSKTKEKKRELDTHRLEKSHIRKYARKATNVIGSRLSSFKRADTDDSSLDSFSDVSSPASPGTPVLKTRSKFEKNIETTKPDQSKMKITGHFQDEFVYFLNTKIRSRRRSALNVQSAVPSDKIILPIPKPGDIVVPHLTDADIEALKQKAVLFSMQNNYSHGKKMAADVSSVNHSVPIQAFSSQSDNIMDDEAKLINTILSMESGEIVSSTVEDNLTFSESRDIMGPGGDGFGLSLLPEQMNLTPEQMEILFNAVDDLADNPDVLTSSNSEQTTGQLSVALKLTHQQSSDEVTSEDLELVSRTTLTSSMSEQDDSSPQTERDPEVTHSNTPPMISDEYQRPNLDKVVDGNDDVETEQVTEATSRQDNLSRCKQEATTKVSIYSDVTNQNFSTEQDIADLSSSQSAYCGPEETNNKTLTLAAFPESVQLSASKLFQLNSGSQNSGSALSDISFSSFEKSSLDLLGNDFKLDKTDLFPEASDMNQCVSNRPTVSEQDYNTPWIVTVNMYWNDLPAVMIDNFPYVRLVDIHKQILPAKDTGILKKRCQLLGIKVKNCIEMQRYFLVQYGKAYNSKSTLIVSKDDAKILIGYYVDPQPKIAKTRLNLELKKGVGAKNAKNRDVKYSKKNKMGNKNPDIGLINPAESETVARCIDSTFSKMVTIASFDKQSEVVTGAKTTTLTRNQSVESLAHSESSAETDIITDETQYVIKTEIDNSSFHKENTETDIAINKPASQMVCSRSTSPLIHMEMQDSDSSPCDETTPSPGIERTTMPEPKISFAITKSRRTDGKMTVTPKGVSYSTRHKKINFIELLKGVTTLSSSVQHDNSTTPDTKQSNRKQKHKKSVNRKREESNSSDSKHEENGKSRKQSDNSKTIDAIDILKSRKRSPCDLEDVRENKVRKISDVNKIQTENTNKKVRETVMSGIIKREKEAENSSSVISSFDSDENVISRGTKRHKHRSLLSVRRRLKNGRRKLNKNNRIIKLKLNGISKSDSTVKKHVTLSRSNTLKIVHKDAGLRNGHRNGIQAGDVHVDCYDGKASACVQCCTCRKLLCVEEFLCHLHDNANGSKLLPVAEVQTLEMRDYCRHGSLQGKLWQIFMRKRELYDNNKLRLDCVREQQNMTADVNLSRNRGIECVTNGKSLSVNNTGKCVIEKNPKQVISPLYEGRTDKVSVRTSARKQKQKQLYPIENYSFTKSAQRIHLKTEILIGDEIDDQSLMCLTNIPHSSGSVLALANGPEVTTFTALEQDVDM